MAKIIIPNGFELYPLDNSDTHNLLRIAYSQRFLWCLENDDIIILPKYPEQKFMDELIKIKKLDRARILVLSLSGADEINYYEQLLCPKFIHKIHCFMQRKSTWTIQVCFAHAGILTFADKINIGISTAYNNFIQRDLSKHLNGKIRFRDLARTLGIPTPEGKICESEASLRAAMTLFFHMTTQLILKQNFNSGAHGNIGITLTDHAKLRGTNKTIAAKKEEIPYLANILWQNFLSKQAGILEIYYENLGTYTVGFSINRQSIHITHMAKILMQETWTGIEMPVNLPPKLCKELGDHTYKIGRYLQEQGYDGYACLDAILTMQNQLLFTEINLRPGAETNIVTIIKKLGLIRKRHIKSIRNIPASGLNHFKKTLKQLNLLFSSKTKRGIIILSCNQTRLAELLLIDHNQDGIAKMETTLLHAIPFC